MVHIFAPEQHDLYDGHFVISAGRTYMVGGLNDPEGWEHLDNDARAVRPASGTAEIDVNEIRNTGTFEARLKIPEGDLVLAMDRWNEFSPCQNGGIVAYIHEHGTDSGCGDRTTRCTSPSVRDHEARDTRLTHPHESSRLLT
jgi:hypothetical protein